MPTYNVGFPYIVVEAPDEKAALACYGRVAEEWFAHGFEPMAEFVEEVPDHAVDAESYEIEEEAED